MTELINRYFGNIVFTKVEQKEGYFIYAAAMTSSYGDGRKQYAVAFVPTHLSIKKQSYLRDLNWHNVQTRTLSGSYRLPQQRWTIPRDVGGPMFVLQERTDKMSRYLPEDRSPLEMILIHDPKNKSKFQYHNRTNLIAALSTFNCVISNTNPYDTPQQNIYTPPSYPQYSNTPVVDDSFELIP